jgi:hypothetical protein
LGFGGAKDLACLAATAGPALCKLAREERLWRTLFEHFFGAAAEADDDGPKPAAPQGGMRRGGGRDPSGVWFRRFAVCAKAERRWRRGAAQSVVLRGHAASGGLGTAATVTCASTCTRRDLRFLWLFLVFFLCSYLFYLYTLSLSISLVVGGASLK